MATTIKTTFQLRRGNAEVWAKNNPVLAAGEPGFELDTGKLKIGNGSDTYNDLPYIDSRLFTFTITPTNGPGSQMLSATRAEMLAALDAGKTLLGYWTETRAILETTDTIKHEFRLESVSGTGANRGLAFVNYEQFYKSTLYVNGNDTVSFVDKEVLPAPMTKTEAMTQSVGMDNNGRLWTEPGADGVGIQSVAQTTTSAEDGGTNVVTVTKTDGTTSTFSIKNGSKGSTGQAGADGHTPIKGTDYWTEADKQEIINSVIAALPDGTEVSY